MTLAELLSATHVNFIDLLPTDLAKLSPEGRTQALAYAQQEKATGESAVAFCRKHAARYGEDMSLQQRQQNDTLISYHEGYARRYQKMIDLLTELS